MAKLHLSLALGDYDRTRPLIDGTVQAEGLDLTVIPLPTPERMFRMAQFDEFDVCESSSAMLDPNCPVFSATAAAARRIALKATSSSDAH